MDTQLDWQRCLARERHAIHPAGEAAIGPWKEWMEDPQPLGIGPVVRVSTTGRVDVHALAAEVDRQL